MYRTFFTGWLNLSYHSLMGKKTNKMWIGMLNKISLSINLIYIPVHVKMLVLKQSLSGKALQLVERLEYTETLYRLALAKLGQCYGLERRLLQRHID
jgi:hypothetical protein